jgi:hypothetical protein
MTTFALIQRLEALAVFVLAKDFDWEVKVKSAQFWTEILNQQQQVKDEWELAARLEQHSLFTALRLGLTDYETSVQAAFKRLLVSAARALPRLLDLDQPLAKIARLAASTSTTPPGRATRKPGLRIRIHLIRIMIGIRIPHFSLNTDPDPGF